MNDIGERLRRVRMTSRLTQRQAAQKIGYSVASIRSWENGDTSPTAEALKKLIDLYNCSADYIFGLAEYKRRRI